MRTLPASLLLLAATAATIATAAALGASTASTAANPATAAPAARAAAGPGSQRIDVPLTDPNRPATVKVNSIRGGISVVAGSNKEVVIEVLDRGEDDDPDERHERHERDAGSDRAPAGAEGMRRIPNRSPGLSVDEENNVVRVVAGPRHASELRLQVPAHSSLNLSCVNGGEIHVGGIEGEMELSNVNGAIEALDVAGVVVAHTTNGGVRVSLRRVAADKAMAFSTLNGDIDVTFPPSLRAGVRLSTGHGEIVSDFAIVPSGRHPADEEPPAGMRHGRFGREVSGNINGGGPEMLFKTFNGDITLHRARG